MGYFSSLDYNKNIKIYIRKAVVFTTAFYYNFFNFKEYLCKVADTNEPKIAHTARAIKIIL